MRPRIGGIWIVRTSFTVVTSWPLCSFITCRYQTRPSSATNNDTITIPRMLRRKPRDSADMANILPRGAAPRAPGPP